MIRQIEMSRAPVVAGEMRPVQIYGDGPFYVTMKCFVFEPPPPKYRDCPECAIRIVREGEVMMLQPSRETWAKRTGTLELHIRDSKGISETVTLRVLPTEEETPSPVSAAM